MVGRSEKNGEAAEVDRGAEAEAGAVSGAARAEEEPEADPGPGKSSGSAATSCDTCVGGRMACLRLCGNNDRCGAVAVVDETAAELAAQLPGQRSTSGVGYRGPAAAEPLDPEAPASLRQPLVLLPPWRTAAVSGEGGIGIGSLESLLLGGSDATVQELPAGAEALELEAETEVESADDAMAFAIHCDTSSSSSAGREGGCSEGQLLTGAPVLMLVPACGLPSCRAGCWAERACVTRANWQCSSNAGMDG